MFFYSYSRCLGHSSVLRQGLLVKEVKLLGLGKLTLHSTRIGATIRRVEVGLSRESIKTGGGWRSDAVDDYIRLEEPGVVFSGGRLLRWSSSPVVVFSGGHLPRWLSSPVVIFSDRRMGKQGVVFSGGRLLRWSSSPVVVFSGGCLLRQDAGEALGGYHLMSGETWGNLDWDGAVTSIFQND